MNQESLEALDEAGKLAIGAIKEYFVQDDTNPEDAGKKADRGLILLSRINGMESNRLKMLALQLQLARAVGLRGEVLRPLLTELNPRMGEVPLEKDVTDQTPKRQGRG